MVSHLPCLTFTAEENPREGCFPRAGSGAFIETLDASWTGCLHSTPKTEHSWKVLWDKRSPSNDSWSESRHLPDYDHMYPSSCHLEMYAQTMLLHATSCKLTEYQDALGYP